MVNWSYFSTENWPSFSIDTATVKVLVQKVDLHLENNFYHAHTEKGHLLEDVNNLWLISYFYQKMWFFHVFRDLSLS